MEWLSIIVHRYKPPGALPNHPILLPWISSSATTRSSLSSAVFPLSSISPNILRHYYTPKDTLKFFPAFILLYSDLYTNTMQEWEAWETLGSLRGRATWPMHSPPETIALQSIFSVDHQNVLHAGEDTRSKKPSTIFPGFLRFSPSPRAFPSSTRDQEPEVGPSSWFLWFVSNSASPGPPRLATSIQKYTEHRFTPNKIRTWTMHSGLPIKPIYAVFGQVLVVWRGF